MPAIMGRRIAIRILEVSHENWVSISKFLPFFGALLLVLLGACSGIQIVGVPTANPDFSPIGDSRECINCGQRALSLCQEADPASYPKWFGFDSAGNCHAQCTRGPAQASSGFRGPANQACPYEVTTTPAHKFLYIALHLRPSRSQAELGNEECVYVFMRRRTRLCLRCTLTRTLGL